MSMIHLVIIAAVVIGLLPAWIARRKGHNFYIWWAYGALLILVALPHSLLLGTGGHKTCGYCRASVKADATHCPQCGYEFIEF